ncbi:hypothetical protein [Novosphingobium sp. B 225]|uniref:hypothetical protein n=1 Tax=Novosphingobium sp. B 225 TaxID=1961849 RepID=UPI000B4B4635|nr:hypothetical protein [Novosphingobium sp. B 225]
MTNAFRLLADGFDMAAKSGVRAELHPSSVEAKESPYARVQSEWKATLNGNTLDLGLLSIRIPEGFLARAIREGTASVEVTDKPGSFARIGGMESRDGAERYWLAESCIDYREIDGRGFELIAAFSLGEPDLRRFGYAEPVDRTAEVYAVRLTVLFTEIFWFVFPTTRLVASELHNATAERTGMVVPLPTFFVNE